MEAAELLSHFCLQSSRDKRIDGNHISIYVALLFLWIAGRYKHPVAVTRREVMEVAKITRTIYHRCMKELHLYGYIHYVPSYHPILGSVVYLNVLTYAVLPGEKKSGVCDLSRQA